jgi:hypothetical protein
MKMIRATAKRTERRNRRIEGVIAQFPSLAPPSLAPLFAGANATYSFVSRTETDSETRIDIEVRDETIVERLASELKACGAVVRVYTREQFDKLNDDLVERAGEG